jgi:hypothetical protein
MNRRILIIAATLVAGVGLAGLSVAAQAGTDPLDGSDVVGALADAPAVGDALPDAAPFDDIGQGGVLADSSRLLGIDGTRSFWVARDAADEICLVVALGDANQTIAAACNRPDRVQRDGLSLGFQGAEGAESVAYLLPDDANVSQLGAPWTVVDANLVTAATEALAEHGTSVPRADGGAIALIP